MSLPTRLGLCPEHYQEFYYPLDADEGRTCPMCTRAMVVYERGAEKMRAALEHIASQESGVWGTIAAQALTERLALMERLQSNATEEKTMVKFEIEVRDYEPGSGEVLSPDLIESAIMDLLDADGSSGSVIVRRKDED